jgi:hypothetical protein
VRKKQALFPWRAFFLAFFAAMGYNQEQRMMGRRPLCAAGAALAEIAWVIHVAVRTLIIKIIPMGNA